MNEYSDNAAKFPTGRWAHGDESQALDKAKQGEAIVKYESRRASAKLLFRHSASEEDRNTAAIVGAFHINPGVADEPDSLTSVDTALLQG
jgi:hypothetical protein